MKVLLLVTAVLMSTSVRAEVQPADVILPFFDFIADKIQDGNNNKVDFIDNDDMDWENPNWGSNVLLQDNGDRILFGTLTIDEVGSDSFVLPRCQVSANDPVSHIRFAVKQANVSIDTVRITFQNGNQQVIAVDNEYLKGTRTEWFALNGLKDRCIKKIRVSGMGYKIKPKKGFGPGHIDFGGGSIGIDINFPGGSNGGVMVPDTAVLQVIGLKN